MSDIQGKARILICDDEVIIAKDLESRLKRLGYTIVGKATSGERTLELVEQHHPDLVMMDIVLQGEMDGIDAAEVIKDKWGIPVVFLTAYANTDRLERAKLTYPFGYLLKPFQDRDLKITTEMALYVSKVDAERRIAQKQLKLFMDNLPGVAFIKDRRGKLIYSNDMYYEVAGLKREDIVGKPYDEYLPPDVADVFRKEDDLVISKNEGIETESIFPTNDGHTYWLTKKFPIEGYKNEIVVGGISIDITDRKQAEEALRESEERHRIIAEVSCDYAYSAIQVEDGVFHVEWVSSAFQKITGYTVQEVNAQKNTWLSVVYPDDIENKIRMVHELDNDSWTTEYRIYTKSGETKYLRDRRIEKKLSSTGQVRIIGGVTDITKQKQAEEQMSQQERTLQTIMDGVPDIIGHQAPDHTILHYNKSAFELFGLPAKDVIGRKCYELIGRPEPCSVCPSLEAVRTGQSQTMEQYFPELNRWFRVNSIPVFKENKQVEAIIEQLTDITARKAAEQKLEAALEETRKREREVSALLDASQAIPMSKSFEDAARSIFETFKKRNRSGGKY